MVFPIKGITMSIDPLFFLYQEDYGIYSRSMAKHLKSLNAAVFLSEVAQRRQYHKIRNELINDERYGDGWFYMTMEKVEERTSLSRSEQDKAIKILIEAGLIEQKNFGVPSKRHFRLKDQEILETYGLSKKQSSLSKSDKLDCRKPTNCIVENKQTAHIYKEPKEEPYQEQQQQGQQTVVVVSENQKNFTKDDAYFAANKFQKDWTSDEIEAGYLAFKDSKHSITSPVEYLDGIIKKQRVAQQSKDNTCQQKIYFKNYSQKQAKTAQMQKNNVKDEQGKFDILESGTKKRVSLLYNSADPTQISLLDLLNGGRIS